MWFRMSKLQDRHSGNLQDAFVSYCRSSLSWNNASGRICCWIYWTLLNAESTDISKKSLDLSLVTICKYQIANFAVVRSNIRVAWPNNLLKWLKWPTRTFSGRQFYVENCGVLGLMRVIFLMPSWYLSLKFKF